MGFVKVLLKDGWPSVGWGWGLQKWFLKTGGLWSGMGVGFIKVILQEEWSLVSAGEGL